MSRITVGSSRSVKEKWVGCARELAPDGVVVETCVDDEGGQRNVQRLKRRGRLWWTPDGEMYVYYEPTHWRLP